MKKAFIISCIFLLGTASQGWAVPDLQLYFDPLKNPGATYNTTDEQWETNANPAEISAFIGLGGSSNPVLLGDIFRIYVSLPDIVTDPNPPDPQYSIAVSDGTLAPDSLGTGGTSPWTFGNPDLQPHGYYPSWYVFFDFTIDVDNLTTIFNVQDGGAERSGYRADFEIAFSSLPVTLPDTRYHFDLIDVSSGIGPGNSGWINVNPFSKDGQRNPGDGGGGGGGDPIPEPGTIVLLGGGLLGLALYGRRSRRS